MLKKKSAIFALIAVVCFAVAMYFMYRETKETYDFGDFDEGEPEEEEEPEEKEPEPEPEPVRTVKPTDNGKEPETTD